jgi:arsenate reductase (glutaredoxin)
MLPSAPAPTPRAHEVTVPDTATKGDRVEIWHNPRCSKSRQTLALLEEAGQEPHVRRYLDDPPSVEELDRVLDVLGMEPWEVTRMGEQRATELGLREWEHDRERWLAALVDNPILIERPIVITGDGRAVLGRPPESVRSLL